MKNLTPQGRILAKVLSLKPGFSVFIALFWLNIGHNKE